MRIEMIRQRVGDAGNADVPGDVAGELALAHAEIAECLRQQPAVMIRGQQERRASVRISLQHRRNIFRAEE
jgi:hypothetical protein